VDASVVDGAEVVDASVDITGEGAAVAVAHARIHKEKVAVGRLGFS